MLLTASIERTIWSASLSTNNYLIAAFKAELCKHTQYRNKYNVICKLFQLTQLYSKMEAIRHLIIFLHCMCMMQVAIYIVMYNYRGMHMHIHTYSTYVAIIMSSLALSLILLAIYHIVALQYNIHLQYSIEYN